MSSPKLSVIIPVYNVEKYLAETIESVINQPCRDMEIILIDDGSPDNSGKICDEYAQRDDRITVIHKENGGVSSARNAGIDAANGEWIAFLDSDDIWFSDFFDKKLDRLLTECDEDCLVFKHAKGDENARVLRYLGGKPSCSDELIFTDPFEKEFCSILYKRSFLNKWHISFYVGVKYGEDRIFLSNALRCAEYKYVDKMIFVYRNTPNSVTKNRKNSDDVYIPLISVRKNYADYYRSKCLNEDLARMNEVCMFGAIIEYIDASLMEFKSIKYIENQLGCNGYIDFYKNYDKYSLPKSIFDSFHKYFKNKQIYAFKYQLFGIAKKFLKR